MTTAFNVVAPIQDASSEPFWTAAGEGKLLIQRCPTTGSFQFYPRPFSLTDRSAEPEWVTASGEGVVYTFSVVHRAASAPLPLPFVVAIVQLSEGPRLLTHVVGCDPADVRIGMAVRVTMTDVGNSTVLPQFTPA